MAVRWSVQGNLLSQGLHVKILSWIISSIYKPPDIDALEDPKVSIPRLVKAGKESCPHAFTNLIFSNLAVSLFSQQHLVCHLGMPSDVHFPLGVVDLRDGTVLQLALGRALGLQTLPAGILSVPV